MESSIVLPFEWEEGKAPVGFTSWLASPLYLCAQSPPVPKPRNVCLWLYPPSMWTRDIVLFWLVIFTSSHGLRKVGWFAALPANVNKAVKASGSSLSFSRWLCDFYRTPLIFVQVGTVLYIGGRWYKRVHVSSILLRMGGSLSQILGTINLHSKGSLFGSTYFSHPSSSVRQKFSYPLSHSSSSDTRPTEIQV